MSIASPRRDVAARAGWSTDALLSPWALIIATVGLVVLLLSLPLTLPIGPMYWDVYLYYDAANRIFDGQVPIVDFFAPVGPLGYYLFAGFVWLFPHAQPTLIAHWSLMAVTLPLMALVVGDVDRRSRTTAFALLIPFLLFALLPFNTREFYPFPGSDGFGIYNRQCCQVLYVLVAALLFVRDRRRVAIVLTASMTALFMLKITGFVAGGCIAAYALLAGRVRFTTALACAAAFLALLAGLELATGIVGAYLADIIALIRLNSDTLAPRFLQAASTNFGIFATTVALAALLLWTDRGRLLSSARQAMRQRSVPLAASVFDHPAAWLLAVLAAGILFETQNTGSQALIFLWPVFLLVLGDVKTLLQRPKMLIAVMALSATAALPPAVMLVERAARTYIGAPKNVSLQHHNLKTLGAVSMRPEVARRLEDMLVHYPAHRGTYDDLIPRGELASPVLYSDFDFQAIYLTAVDRAIDSIHAIEAEKGIRFQTLMSLNFVNPFPWLMERSAPRYITIGADPMRAVPTPGEKENQAVADADLVLYPTCPPTIANMKLYELYAPALARHKRIKLDACYDAFVNPKLASAFK